MKADARRLSVHPGLDLAARLAQLQARIGGRIALGLRSQSMRYGLRRDLGASITNPSAKIPIAVRPLAEADLDRFLSIDTGKDGQQERREVAWRRAFVEKGAHGGFVAVDTRSDTPCYVQWLLGPAENAFIAKLGGFPALSEGEALLENAYTPPQYRGLGIMSAAMALIAERGADIGARHVLTFVDQHNIASLKGCQRAGFNPHLLHHRAQMAFGLWKRDSFETLPADDPRRTARF